jgi:branched-chain amino acid transport system ATP-binding protein
MLEPLLRLDDVSVSYGGVRALDRVSFDVSGGSLHGLIGPNGAGKTTTLDALTGFTPHRGRVHFDGEDLTGWPPHARARRGLVRTWQSLELFEDLTVLENCRVATARQGIRVTLGELVGMHRRADASDGADVDWAIDLLGLGPIVHRRPSELSLGQRKLAALARALARRPRMLLLDEPAAGLDTGESQALGERLTQVVAGGVTLLLVDHDMGLVLGVCDRVTVLDFGRVIAEGTPEQIRYDHRVVEAYLGEASAS